MPPNHSIHSLHHKRFCMICKLDRPLTGGSFVSGQGVPRHGLVQKFVCASCIPGVSESLKAKLVSALKPTRR